MWKKLRSLWLDSSGPSGPVLRAVDTQNLYPAMRVFRLRNGYLLEFIDRSEYTNNSDNSMEFYTTPVEIADAIVRRYATAAVMGKLSGETKDMKGHI